MSNTSQNTLFPSHERRAQLNTALSAQIDSALAKIAAGSASPTLDMGAFRQKLMQIDFDAPQAWDDLTDWTITSMRDGQVHMTHPRYFGLFNPAPTFPAECADRIAAAFNPQICVWSHAPVAVDIEAHVIRRLAARIGMPAESGGHFTSGGSEANHTAVICALTAANTNFATQGARAFTGQPRIYASKESHLAWLKIAHECGIGRAAVCLVDTDGYGRMDPVALEQAINDDNANGHVPVLIAATAGTTNAGMIDPLHACSDIARRSALWLHVDAAWGGALIVSDALKHELAGIECADSVTIDAHKWFATTMGAGMYFTAHSDVLADAFHVSTSYMPSNDQAVDLYVNSMQWSRRFIGLRLFLSLAAVGWAGYAEHVERGVALIDRLNDALRGHGWTVVNDSRMAVTCLVPPKDSKPVKQIVDEIVADGRHWVSMTKFEDVPVVRACITNGKTAIKDIDSLVVALEVAASA